METAVSRGEVRRGETGGGGRDGGGAVGVPYGAVSTDWQTGPAELSADTVLD